MSYGRVLSSGHRADGRLRIVMRVRRRVSPPDDPGDGFSLRETGSKPDPLISLENFDLMDRVHLPQRAAGLAELFLVLLVPR